MNTSQNMEKILDIIREIESKTHELKNTDKISKIEMDILLERVRFLYDNLISIDHSYPYDFQEDKKQRTVIPTPEKPQKKTSEPKEPEESEKTEQQYKDPEIEIKQEEKHEETSSQQEKTKEKEPNISQEQTVRETEYKESQKRKENGPEIVADKYQNTKTFRHDNLAKNQTKKVVSSKMQDKPIQDLVKAIGINDKFLFIRELFDGDKEKYHEAIQLLNEIPTYEEADNYLKETFDWDWEKPEVKKFIDLIRRKFV